MEVNGEVEQFSLCRRMLDSLREGFYSGDGERKRSKATT